MTKKLTSFRFTERGIRSLKKLAKVLDASEGSAVETACELALVAKKLGIHDALLSNQTAQVIAILKTQRE